jgi:hypothetical protein
MAEFNRLVSAGATLADVSEAEEMEPSEEPVVEQPAFVP